MDYKAVIIDDETWTRTVIKSLGEWEKYGIKIVGEASDGDYGLELIRQMSPDIILTDVCMPHLNGLELIERLRNENNGAQVIFISGYDDYSYIRSALKLDAIDYLLKPVKGDELNNQLEMCIKVLNQREDSKKEHDLAEGFLKVSWASQYYVLRDALFDSLNSDNLKVIEQKFEAIQNLIEKKEGEKPEKGSMICVYYTLMNSLQRFIYSKGYSLSDIFNEEETTFVFSRESTCTEMLAFVKRLYCLASLKIQDFIKNRNRLDLDQIKKYIDEHYTEGITLEETANAFYVSKEYLSKTFKGTVGKGFSEYVTALRMEKAKLLILEYGIPIKEVGAMVGYLDQAHFYKTFKKFYGKTPGEMREV
ncbi:MAG: response regulator [Clostridiales bacterium]|nr:response regulator [Clostridiales bacterium]